MAFVEYIKSKVSGDDFQVLFKALTLTIAGATVVAVGIATFTGK